MKNKFLKVSSGLWLPLLGLVMVWGFMLVPWSYEKKVRQDQITSDFKDQSQVAFQVLQAKMRSYDALFLGVKGFFAGSDKINAKDLKHWTQAQQLFQSYPDIHSLNVLLPLTEEEVGIFDKTLGEVPRASRLPSVSPPYAVTVFKIKPIAPPQTQPFYDLAPGDDVGASPQLHLVFQKSKESGHPVFFSFPAETPKPGITSWSGWVIPLYKNGKPTKTAEDRNKSILAWMVISLDVARSFKQTLAPFSSSLVFKLNTPLNTVPFVVGGEGTSGSGLNVEFKAKVSSGDWTMGVSPSRQFLEVEDRKENASDWILLLGGVMGPMVALITWGVLRPSTVRLAPKRSELPDEVLETPLYSQDGESSLDYIKGQDQFLIQQVLTASDSDLTLLAKACANRNWEVASQYGKKLTKTAMALNAPRLFLISQALDKLLSESTSQKKGDVPAIKKAIAQVQIVLGQTRHFFASVR